MSNKSTGGLEIDWQETHAEIQVTVLGRFLAADKRSMRVDYNIDELKRIITLRCTVEFRGKRYHHDSVLRGFCIIPKKKLGDVNPDEFDWLTEEVD